MEDAGFENLTVEQLQKYIKQTKDRIAIITNTEKIKNTIKKDEAPTNITVNIEDIYTTRTVIKTEETITAFYEIARAGGKGLINQILYKTDSNDYTVQIFLDNYTLFDRDYSYFYDYSSILENISAYDLAGYYYLSIRTLNFLEKFIINVVPNSSITFNEIHVKYTIRDEHYI
ncbi:hypothetical protein LCGC14_0223810 [marine sediment metagenome]|uniref:Uncharacterized protein n=1 Tax=marine sediment metagenome TaxID=412755 RepID=A0A0F9XFY9_9ZZZZ